MAPGSIPILNADRTPRLTIRYALMGAGLLLFIIAFLLHHNSNTLPREYTWLFPMQLFGNAATIVGFWSALGAVLFSVCVMRGWLSPTLSTNAFQIAAYTAWPLAVWLDGAPALLLAIAITTVVLFLCIRNIRPTKTQVLWVTSTTLMIVGSVLASSYVYTVIKAYIFLFRNAQDPSIVAIDGLAFSKPIYTWFADLGTKHSAISHALDYVYVFFFAYMLICLAGLLLRGDRKKLRQYCIASLLCYLLGAPLYFVIPTMGPAFFDAHAFQFVQEQGLISGAIQAELRHNMASLLAGNLHVLPTFGFVAAIPSLHVTHTVIIGHFSKTTRTSYVVALAFTFLTAISTLVLGWHYWIDVLAGALLAWPCLSISLAAARDPELASDPSLYSYPAHDAHDPSSRIPSHDHC